MRSARERRPRSELLSRILVGVPAAALVIVFIELGGLAFALFMIAVALACLHELYRLLARWRPIPALGFAAAVGGVFAARYGGPTRVLEVTIAALPVLAVLVLVRPRRGRPTAVIAATLFGLFWIALPFAHGELLRRSPHGASVLLDVLIGTFLGDTAAYLGGRLFGRHRLAPEISPNKTFEGLFCGMLIALAAVFVAGRYQDTWMTAGRALALGATVALLAPIGDLFESLIKRDVGIKDSGSLFGAHGGALDRLDAVLFTVPAAYWVWFALIHFS